MAMPSRILSSRIKDRDIYFSIFIRQCNFFVLLPLNKSIITMRFFQIVCLSLALTLGNAGITTFAQNGNNYFLHTVSRGQSLYSIANMYHVSIDDIVRLNPGSDKQIRVGEALKIPQANSSSSSKNGRFHTIQAGETLYQLTVKYNISAQAICDANPGLSASNFRVGQVISIPTESVTDPVTPSLQLNLPLLLLPRKDGKKCIKWNERKLSSASVRNMASHKKICWR